MSTDVWILDGARTPFGKFGGALREMTATDLAVVASSAALGRAGVAPDEVDQVIIGTVGQTSTDAVYLARHVGLRVGCPIAVPALIVNRICGSGFQAIIAGAEQILLGAAGTVLVGGTESMSQAPHVIRGARWGLALGQGALEDSLWAMLTDTYCGLSMAVTAEKLAGEFKISRDEADLYAYRSQRAAAAFVESGAAAEEITPVPLGRGATAPATADRDEHPRPGTTLEGLAALRPVFQEDGIVTAGNASGICDGAAALVLMRADRARERRLRPLGRLVAWGVVGVEPSLMGLGPVPAARAALARAGRTLEEMDCVEVNEAFAPQYLAVEKALGLHRDVTNVNGGAIALGHPLGATGARLTLTLLYELRRRGLHYGLGSACIGGGQGIAVIVEALGV